jgi:Carboxypeptidase regulatory-like domain
MGPQFLGRRVATCLEACVLFLFLPALLAIFTAAQSTVEGVVVDGDWKAIAVATVVLQRADGGSLLETKSDAAGKFQFPAVEAGSQTVKAEATDFYPSRYEFVLRPRQPITIELNRRQSVQQTVQVHPEYLPDIRSWKDRKLVHVHSIGTRQSARACSSPKFKVQLEGGPERVSRHEMG